MTTRLDSYITISCEINFSDEWGAHKWISSSLKEERFSKPFSNVHPKWIHNALHWFVVVFSNLFLRL